MSSHLTVQLPETVQILHLGDSYTSAEGIATHRGWPIALGNHLRQEGFRVTWQEVLATNGWSSEQLLQALQKRSLQREWNLVTLCIGVNDQYRRLPLDAYKRNLSAILGQTIELCCAGSSGVLMVSIPDWTASPFCTAKFAQQRSTFSQEIDQFNAVARSMALEKEVRFLDWTDHSRTFHTNPAAFADDTLHPSVEQHAAMAEVLMREVTFQRI